MSLRSKIVLILVTVVVGYAPVENGLTRFSTASFWERWEHDAAAERLGRVRQRFDRELADLAGRGRVFAGTRGMKAFAAGTLPDYPATDLGAPAMERAEVDLFYVLDADGRVLWGDVLDPGTRAPMRLAEFPREALSASHVAIRFPPGGTSVSGVMTTRFHPLLFSTVPIPDADGRAFVDAPGEPRLARGALVLGRFLGPELERRIVSEELALVHGDEVAAAKRIDLLEPGAEGLPREVLGGEGVRRFAPGPDGLLHGYERIDSLRTGEPLVLHVALDRAVEEHRRLTANIALLSTLIGGLLVLVVLLRLLQRIVIAPLSTLTSKAVEIGRRDDTTVRVGMQRDDEVGQLANEFDRMIEKLARSREQVVQTARLAGRSEIATGVLHNVGNVLNSVNVSANLATRRTEELSLGDLEMLVGVLEEHGNDLASFVGRDPRGQHLVPFLREVAQALSSQRRALHDELRALNQGIDHIAELVRAQQSHAGTKGVFEQARLADQVDAALAICKQSLAACPGLVVERDYAELPSVSVDKHKLMEILVNVVQNAGQALAESATPDKRLLLRLSRPDERTARIEVRDNGVGIAPEDLTRVFHHGFTTKKDGHGFGLHVSANAATEMGAKLRAESDGPGRGATFVLDIPLERELALAAA